MNAELIAPDETARLVALADSGLFGTPDEYTLDCITGIGAKLFDMPICIVSLVGKDEQWFKSCVGLTERSTPRSEAFCAHVVAAAAPMIVTDARLDERFATSQLVVGPPGIRFYAGHPLTDPRGVVLGALCVIDRRPRSFSDTQKALLRDLAALAELAIAARRISGAQKALLRQLEEARRESLIDPMLRIWNRGGIRAILDEQHEISTESGEPFSVLLLDVDHFKRINDVHGHQAGDAALLQITRALKSSLRPGDEVGRYGGEEFLVVLASTKATSAERIARRVNEAIASTSIKAHSACFACTASLGVAEWSFSAGESVDAVIRRADAALMSAKYQGRNRVLVSRRAA